MSVVLRTVMSGQMGSLGDVAASNDAQVITTGTAGFSFHDLEDYLFLLEAMGADAAYIKTVPHVLTTYYHTVTFQVRSKFNIAAEATFFTCNADASGSNPEWKLTCTGSGGAFKLYDSNGVVKKTLSGAYAKDTNYRFIALWKRGNSDEFYLYLDGSLVYSTSTFDSDKGSGTSMQYVCWAPGQGADDRRFYFSPVIGWDDTAATALQVKTRLPNPAILVYRKTDGGSSSQFSSGAPDAWSSGTWANATEIPGNDSNYGQFSVNAPPPRTPPVIKKGGISTNTGSKAGPSGDADLTGMQIHGGFWTWRYQFAAGGTGGAGAKGHVGRADGSPNTYNMVSTTLDAPLEGTPRVDQFVSSSSTYVPDASDHFQIGWEAQNISGTAKDFQLLDCWCGLVVDSLRRVVVSGVVFNSESELSA